MSQSVVAASSIGRPASSRWPSAARAWALGGGHQDGAVVVAAQREPALGPAAGRRRASRPGSSGSTVTSTNGTSQLAARVSYSALRFTRPAATRMEPSRAPVRPWAAIAHAELIGGDEPSVHQRLPYRPFGHVLTFAPLCSDDVTPVLHDAGSPQLPGPRFGSVPPVRRSEGSDHGSKLVTRSPTSRCARWAPRAPRRSGRATCSGSGKVVLFAVPGAFTPGCSKIHLPGFVADADSVKAKGVDKIVCMSINDAWVMEAWGKDAGRRRQDPAAGRRQRRLRRRHGPGLRRRRLRPGQALAALRRHHRGRRDHQPRRRARRWRRRQLVLGGARPPLSGHRRRDRPPTQPDSSRPALMLTAAPALRVGVIAIEVTVYDHGPLGEVPESG